MKNNANLSTLQTPDIIGIESSLGLMPVADITSENLSDDLRQKAIAYVDSLFTLSDRDLVAQKQYSDSVETLGDTIEQEIQRKSKFLMTPATSLNISYKKRQSP
ncbi:MAG: hypothetical protein ISR69_13290 [Gammaproteobacteria bacterium]|nr:hypothetical protein [Gammaproteobacteria bacterium]